MEYSSTSAYWKIFHTIKTSRYIHIIGDAIPRLLNQFKKIYGETAEYFSLLEQYEEKLNKYNNKN